MTTQQHLADQAGKITKKLARMSHQKPWADSMLYLMQLPGFSVITGVTVLAAIGDITRFETAGHLVSYSGLIPGMDQSGVKLRHKRIAKEGRKSNPTHSGNSALMHFKDVCTATRRSWRSLVSCWNWSGMF